MARYHVIFRSHDLVAHHSKYPRPFALDKRTLIKVCFLSLIQGLEGQSYRIQILGDRLTEETLQFLKRFPVTILNEELGPTRALRRAVELALESDDDEWIYLCEDDYLHHPDTFRNLDDLLDNRSEYLAYKPKPRWRRLVANDLDRKPLFIYLADYPDRYRPKYKRRSFVFHSKYCHWRQVTATSYAIMGQGREFKRRARLLLECAENLDDGGLSRRLYGDMTFFRRALCLSPIPALTSHMHEEKMSPLVDWRSICDRYRAELEALER
jgi:hypothetical protein